MPAKTKTIRYRDQEYTINVQLEHYPVDASNTVTRHRIIVAGENSYLQTYRIDSDLDLKTEILKIINKTKKHIDSELEVSFTPDEEVLHNLGFK